MQGIQLGKWIRIDLNRFECIVSIRCSLITQLRIVTLPRLATGSHNLIT